jgi:hypothetical protein
MEGAMTAAVMRWGMMVGAGLLLASLEVGAQDTPTYKCVSRGRVVYSQTVCPGGREVGPGGKPRVNVRYEAPSQGRAKIARRAALSAQAKQECTALDGRLVEQQRELKAKGDTVTLHDEMPLVFTKKRFRELKC